jgi:putative toxin-antitoxin system antitoxin component (TIGR02293 family)
MPAGTRNSTFWANQQSVDVRTERFLIGEVCELVGVQPHVLRYWETEFPMLSPQKTKSGSRQYSRGDLEIALRIKQLLYDEMYTIAGAKKRLYFETPRGVGASVPKLSRIAGKNRTFTATYFLGLPALDNLSLARAVESGLAYDTLEHLAQTSGLSVENVRVVVGIASRTLIRRKQENRLSTEESDRLVSLARLLALTFGLFEGNSAGLDWFMEPNGALGGMAPISAASTEIGSREVENLIGRLEHGVLA